MTDNHTDTKDLSEGETGPAEERAESQSPVATLSPAAI